MTTSSPSLADARRWFAEDVCFGFGSPELVEAFATTPREAFVGPRPWLIQTRYTDYVQTPDADPRHLYHAEAHVALDAANSMNSGGPGLTAWLMHVADIRPGAKVLAIGTGCGYCGALFSRLVGETGGVTCVEIDPDRAKQAGEALRPWKQARVICGNGATESFRSADVVFVGAGASAIQRVWLDAMAAPGGRLVFPLAGRHDAGRRYGPAAYIRITRLHDEERLGACVVAHARSIECVGAWDEADADRVSEALASDGGAGIRSLRIAHHLEDPLTCRLHGSAACLSRLSVEEG